MILLLRSSMLQIFLSVCTNFFTEQYFTFDLRSTAPPAVRFTFDLSVGGPGAARVEKGLDAPIRCVPCKLQIIYFKISIVPPAPSIALLALPLTACTLKPSLDFNSPTPRIFTRSVWLINPLTYRFSGVNSVIPYFSASESSWPRLKTLYSTRWMLLKPRLGTRRWIGIWPPSCAFLRW